MAPTAANAESEACAKEAEKLSLGSGVRFQASQPSFSTDGSRTNSINDDLVQNGNTTACKDTTSTAGGSSLRSPQGKLKKSVVAETLRSTSPYGLVQSAEWILPSSKNDFARRITTPVLHSLLGGQVAGGAPSKPVCRSRDQLFCLQQMSHADASVPKHAELVYESCVNSSPCDGAKGPISPAEIAQDVEKLVALQMESESGGTQSQDLDETGHADLSKVKTETDAVAFFARHGSTTKTKFLFCNRASTDPLVFEPYKLVVVPRSQINPEHFTISATAVMHICPGKPSECIRQEEWMRQAFVHSLLRSLPFFKSFVARRVLNLWSHATRKYVFEQKRDMLCTTLFIAKPIYCEHLLQIHKVLSGLSSVKLIDLKPVLYDISQFNAQQHALRSDPKMGTGKVLEVSTFEYNIANRV